MRRRYGQRMSTGYASDTMARRRRKETLHGDSKGRRPGSYRCSSDTAYRLRMSDPSPPAEDWAGYLRRMTKRDGWSVQRLADESGVHRSRIFKYMAGDVGVTIDTIRRIAHALGDAPENALRAAAQIGAPTTVRDEEMELIERAPVDEELKRSMREKLLAHREQQRRASINYVQDMIDFAKRED